MKKASSLLLVAIAVIGCSGKAAFHKEYRNRIAHAASADERRYLELEYQILCAAEKKPLKASFAPQDGISEFEAWMLAKIYSGEEIGSCLDIGLPRRQGHQWLVPTFVGRPAKDGPPIMIDSASGKITCEGHPTVDRPLEYLEKFEAKFKKT